MYEPRDHNAYEPEVDDYVVWERPNGDHEEGWVYFKGEPTEKKRGFPYHPHYITIEVSVRPKPHCRYSKGDPHKMIHSLLLCYVGQWKELRYVKSRKHAKDSVERDEIDYIEYTKIHKPPKEESTYHSQQYRYEDVQ
tara:strand:- start:1629 stop:2039 length:411 start_codon:yes stop_codon:yes gene_type:complete